MFDSTRAYINALKEKNIAKKIKLYDASGNNLVPISKDSYPMTTVRRRTEGYRKHNLIVYTKSMAKLTGLRLLYATPIILGGLTIVSFANIKYVKSINVDDVYHNMEIEFDEEYKLYELDETMASTFFNKNYVDESIQSNHMTGNDKSSYATIYYGEGSDSFQVKFDINADNTWSYSSHTNNLYQKSQVTKTEPIGEIDEEYKQLIKDVTETFIKQADLSEEDINLLREIITNNENDIIVRIKRCVNIGPQNLEVHSYHWLRCLIAVILEIILVASLVENSMDLTRVRGLRVDDGKIEYDILSNYKNLLNASSHYKKALLEAEGERIDDILDVLRRNSADEEIIAAYKKRSDLLNKEKKLIMTKDN